MKQLAVTQFPMPILTIVALMIFLISFALITVWAYRFLSNEKVQQLANLALDIDKEGK
jgi:cbb3-type cytochrome oxidase subunit 3